MIIRSDDDVRRCTCSNGCCAFPIAMCLVLLLFRLIDLRPPILHTEFTPLRPIIPTEFTPLRPILPTEFTPLPPILPIEFTPLRPILPTEFTPLPPILPI